MKTPAKKAYFPLIESVFLLSYIFVFIWIVHPLQNLLLTFFVVIFAIAFTVVSHLIHNDSLKSIGIRTDNIPDSLKEVGTFTLISAAILIAGGIGLKGMHIDDRLFILPFGYFVWAFFQQYFFQSFFNNRLKDAFGDVRWTVLLNAFIFGSVHWPNLFLSVVTFVAGIFWSFSFRKNPNLVTISISHGILAVMLLYLLPESVTHRLYIGPYYYQRLEMSTP